MAWHKARHQKHHPSTKSKEVVISVKYSDKHNLWGNSLNVGAGDLSLFAFMDCSSTNYGSSAMSYTGINTTQQPVLLCSIN